MSKSKDEVATIRVSKEVKEMLEKYGRIGITYKNVIVKLLNNS